MLTEPAANASLYLGGRYAQALEFLCAAREGPANITLLISEPGLGKTCLLRAALARLEPGSRTAFVFWTQLEPLEFIQHLLSAAGVSEPAGDVATAQKQLQEVLQDSARAGKRFVLAIDEAQNLSPEALEKLSAVLDFGLAKTGRLHVIFAALPGFTASLERPQARRLQERVGGVVSLAALTHNETAEYIEFRSRRAGEARLPQEEARRIVSGSGGVPRVIDQLCDEALRRIAGNEQETAEITLLDSALGALFPAGQLPRYAIPFEPAQPPPSAAPIARPAATADVPARPPAAARERAAAHRAPAPPASPPRPAPSRPQAGPADPSVAKVCEWFLEPRRSWSGTPAELAVASGAAAEGLAERLQASADVLRGFGVQAAVVRRPGRPRMITLSRLSA
ncbi:MAG TPA: AAA family ATPase [Terriglobales bacterium]|nr:AAA family ATPase [Terriglobales bacterium]